MVWSRTSPALREPSPMAANPVNVVDMPSFADDFDEYRARASSGGSLYGVVKRQVFAAAAAGGSGTDAVPTDGSPTSAPKRPPQERPMKRQRSKSLIPRGVAVPEERSILQMLYEYSEDTNRRARLRHQHEPRRYSAACVDARDVNRRPLSPHRRCLQHQPIPQFPATGALNDSPSLAPVHASSTTNSAGEHLSRRRTKVDRDLHLPLKSTASPQPERRNNDVNVSPPPTVNADGDAAAVTNLLSPPTHPTICRRRSFSMTPKGLVNEGDDLVALVSAAPLAPTTASPAITHSHQNPVVANISQETDFGSASSEMHLLSGQRSRTGSCTSAGSGSSCDSGGDMSVYRVLMLGGPGVGKTALTQQFLTSECMIAQNTSFDTGIACTVPVLLDSEESVLEFYDLPYTGELDVWRDYDVDCYIIVYSITDRRGYKKATELLADIRRHKGGLATLILVANKSDLERARMVAKQEGKVVAESFDCKYTEVSAILNHKVDELLVGILKQIRLNQQKRRVRHKKPSLKESGRQVSTTGCSLVRAGDCAFHRFLRKARGFTKSCEDLFAS